MSERIREIHESAKAMLDLIDASRKAAKQLLREKGAKGLEEVDKIDRAIEEMLRDHSELCMR